MIVFLFNISSSSNKELKVDDDTGSKETMPSGGELRKL